MAQTSRSVFVHLLIVDTITSSANIICYSRHHYYSSSFPQFSRGGIRRPGVAGIDMDGGGSGASSGGAGGAAEVGAVAVAEAGVGARLGAGGGGGTVEGEVVETVAS